MPDQRSMQVMSDTQIKERIRSFLMKHVKSERLREDEDIFKAGFVNSLFAMQLVLFVEKEFQIKVRDDDLAIENFRSINAIVRLVAGKESASGN